MATFDRDTAHAIQLRAFRDFLHMLGEASDGARVLEHEGLVASVVPEVPSRSVPNSVSYLDLAALEAAYNELAATYDDVGVNAWTVWAPDFDAEAAELLSARGHAFDGKPAAMILDLAELGEVDLGDLDWDAECSMSALGEVNDLAYGHDPGEGYAPALAREPEGVRFRLYRALVDGEVASVMGTIDHEPVDGAAGPDCGIYFVGTPERYRGRGLASRLLLAALGEARERGCATSSLQASPMGQPIYERLGYRPYFRFHMYERRGSA